MDHVLLSLIKKGGASGALEFFFLGEAIGRDRSHARLQRQGQAQKQGRAQKARHVLRIVAEENLEPHTKHRGSILRGYMTYCPTNVPKKMVHQHFFKKNNWLKQNMCFSK